MSATTLSINTPLNTSVFISNIKKISLDEIDNKTQDTYNTHPARGGMPELKFECNRLQTFERWPLDFIDKETLAQTGMFYTGESDKVKCYFCDVEIGRWEINDHPVYEHMKWSPNCPLLRRRTVSNVPINMEALDRVLPPISYDVCGLNRDAEQIEVHVGAYAEDTITTSTQGQPFYQMEYPAYAVEGARFRSFAEWPRVMKQKPKDLAEAGFFYAGNGDRVNCFSCGGGLKDWDENDDPWEQHAVWLKKCRYLKLMKGQEYIDSVIAKQKLAAGKSVEASNTTSTSTSTSTETPESVERCDTKTITGTSTAISKTATTTGSPTLSRDAVQRSNSNSSTERGNIPEDKLCKICMAAEYNTTFLPCGHVVACARCASSVNKCPMCRKPFVEVMRVYFS